MTDENRLKDLHTSTIATLAELAETLRDAIESNDRDAIEAAERAIDEDPLEIRVRSGWHCPGEQPGKPEEFEILLSTGGPAMRIRGQLDYYGQPETFHVEVQDWFQPWQSFGINADQGDLIRDYYLSQFYFGE